MTAATFVSGADPAGSLSAIDPATVRSPPRHQSGRATSSTRSCARPDGPSKAAGTVDSWNERVAARGRCRQARSRRPTRCSRAHAGRFGQGLLDRVKSVGFTRAGPRSTIIQEPSGIPLVRDPSQVQLDPELRLPYTNQYPIGLDRELGHLLAVSVVHPEGRPRFHRMDGTRGHVSRRVRDPGRCQVRAGLEIDHPFGGTSLSADEPGGLLADLQRPGDRCRTQTSQRLAGFRVLHSIEGVPPAPIERNDRSGTASRDRGFPARFIRPRRHLRPGSDRSHQRLRPLASPIARIWLGS